MSRAAGPQVLGIVGHSGSGKTTLIERLVPRLRDRGLKVAVLKHDAHRLELDRPGKDSYRFRESGADAVVVASAETVFMTMRPPEVPTPAQLIETCFAGMELDLVLVEGYTGSGYAKLEVRHLSKSARTRGAADGVVAWVVRSPCQSTDLPVLQADDLDDVIEFLARAELIPPAEFAGAAGIHRLCVVSGS